MDALSYFFERSSSKKLSEKTERTQTVGYETVLIGYKTIYLM